MIRALFTQRMRLLHWWPAESYFQNLFTAGDIVWDPEGFEASSKVSVEMNNWLTRPVSDLEIKEAVYGIGQARAPGSDGFTGAFYQQFWNLITPDVNKMVRGFFETSIMERSINHTHICLIPKSTEASMMKDYRPISLCSVSYKIISKILMVRMKVFLNDLISESQADFVPGRNIQDNIMVAHELMHALKSKKDVAEKYIGIKTDISKAYDRVEWNFLEKVMEKIGL